MENLLYPQKYLCKEEEDFKFNKNIIKKIIKFAEKGKLPHIIFHGDYGSGKLSIILYFLKILLKTDKVYNRNSIPFTTSDGNNEWTINIIKSPYYFELDAADFGYNDKKILSSFISEICKNVNVITNKYNIIIIKNAENLSIDAQYTFRRIMEKNFKSCRIIFSTHNTALIDESIISRCIMFRIPSPKNKELYDYLSNICDNESIPYNSPDLKEIVIRSKRNINISLLLLQISYKNGVYEKVTFNQELFLESVIEEIQDYKNYKPLVIRNKIYLMLLHNISIHEFMEKLIQNIFENQTIDLNFNQKKKIIRSALYYNKTSNMGYRNIYHMETFVNFLVLILHGIDVKEKFDNL